MGRYAITSIHNGMPTSTPLVPVITLLNNLLRGSVLIGSKCGGRGKCGTCRVRILSRDSLQSPIRPTERLVLKEKLEDGWRLACQTFVATSIRIEIPPLPPIKSNPSP